MERDASLSAARAELEAAKPLESVPLTHEQFDSALYDEIRAPSPSLSNRPSTVNSWASSERSVYTPHIVPTDPEIPPVDDDTSPMASDVSIAGEGRRNSPPIQITLNILRRVSSIPSTGHLAC